MRRNLIWAAMITLTLSLGGNLKADIVMFDFVDDVVGDPTEPFDGGGVGASATIGGLTLTTVDLLAPEYEDDGTGTFVATGNTLSALAGDAIETNIQGNADALGVNNLTINNGEFDTLGAGTEANDFNVGESWVFNFDQDVEFTEFEFESVEDVDILEVFVNGALVETFDNDFDGFSNGTNLGALEGLTITAGTSISFSADGVNVPEDQDSAANPSTSFRLESFSVHVKAVPEPSSLFALVGMAGLFAVRRRR